MPTAPQGDAAAVAELARLLVAAENPVLVADRLARTPAAMPLLVELAETLQAAVIDKGGRMNFPSLHPLNQSERANAVIAAADVVVGLEVTDFWGTVNAMRDQQHRTQRPLTKPGARLDHNHHRRAVRPIELSGFPPHGGRRSRHRRRRRGDAPSAHRSGQAARHRRPPARLSRSEGQGWPRPDAPRSNAHGSRLRTPGTRAP